MPSDPDGEIQYIKDRLLDATLALAELDARIAPNEPDEGAPRRSLRPPTQAVDAALKSSLLA
jgi:hypothetical protein